MRGNCILYGYGTPSAYVHSVFADEAEGTIRLKVVRGVWPLAAHKFTLHSLSDVLSNPSKDSFKLKPFVLSPGAPAPKKPEGIKKCRSGENLQTNPGGLRKEH